MQSKDTINDTESANNQIGQAIHDAKRRMLDAHKRGVSLTAAAETFFAECRNAIDLAVINLSQPEHRVPPYVENLRSELKAIDVDAPSPSPSHDYFEKVRQVEIYAAQAVVSDEESKQIALLQTLKTISDGRKDAAGIAYNALQAAFKQCDCVFDDALSLLLAAKEAC